MVALDGAETDSAKYSAWVGGWVLPGVCLYQISAALAANARVYALLSAILDLLLLLLLEQLLDIVPNYNSQQSDKYTGML